MPIISGSSALFLEMPARLLRLGTDPHRRANRASKWNSCTNEQVFPLQALDAMSTYCSSGIALSRHHKVSSKWTSRQVNVSSGRLAPQAPSLPLIMLSGLSGFSSCHPHQVLLLSTSAEAVLLVWSSGGIVAHTGRRPAGSRPSSIL
jgi:hypothetical protein